MRRSVLHTLLIAVLALLPLAACQAGSGDAGAQDAQSDAAPTDAAEGTDTAGGEPAPGTGDDAATAERMAAEHEGDTPVPAFAGDSERYDDVEVTTERVQYATVEGEPVTGYLAVPAGAQADPETPLPGLIVIHEWWGLNDNVETMARRYAHHGYTALAVDLYGGSVAEAPDRARELMSGVDAALAKSNLRQAHDYLQREHAAPTVGVVGWCFGGGWSLQTALLLPEEIDATVIYYGRLVTDERELATLEMPILGHFGADDQGIPVETVREFEATLDELGKDATIHVYQGAGHAFANPSGQRYQPQAAKTAWDRTLDFFDRHLKR